jgi:apolipoprotein N-acyltransferase
MNLDRHIELSRRAARDGATLVVWPESAVAFDWDRYPAVAAELRALTRDLGAFLLFGNDDREGPEEAPRLFVGAKLLAPDGQLLLRYHKVRLVPFGEYVPLQPILTLGGRYAARLVQQVSDFTPGDTALVGRIGAASLGVSICYEAIFPDYVRQFTANGAGMLVNITNDAWYGTTSAPFQHFAMARFRAVENGRYLVRAANTGISAVVDPRGRVLARSELFDRTTLVYDVPQTDGLTFYARYGDVFGWSAVAVSAALLAVSRGKRQAG